MAYELALQQTVVLTVRASEHLPDPSLVTSCTVEAIDHSDDSTETWPASLTVDVSVLSLETRTAWPALSTTVS